MGVEAAPTRGSQTQDDSRTLVARLAAGIAHELRNPLAVILARVQLLALSMKSGKAPDADKLSRTVKTIEEQALRASRIIESLSAFARPRPPEAQTVHLAVLVNHVTDTLARRFTGRPAIQTAVEMAPEASSLRADPDQVLTALMELLTNAFEAMPDGGRLRIESRRRDGLIDLIVADSGRGVAAHDGQRIFEPFFSTKPGSAGLGLCVAQTIAEAHGGSVRLANAGLPGAEFVFTLPAEVPAPS